jgi:hypothetical protein
MATTVYFDFTTNNVNQPLTGSKVSMIGEYGPLVNSNNSIAFSGPVPQYTDITGSVTFPNVIPAIYKVIFTNANYTNQPYYVGYSPESFYVNIPETNGGTINGSQYIIASLPPPNLSGSYFALNSFSSSYSLTASYAANSSGGPTTSASYALTSSNTTMYPDITDNILTGFVGINQSNPSYVLDVNGTIGNSIGGLSLASSNNMVDISFPNDDLLLSGSGTNNSVDISPQHGNITICSAAGTTGFVGINQPNPEYNLDVSGSVNFISGIYQHGLPYTASQANSSSYSIWADSSSIQLPYITEIAEGFGYGNTGINQPLPQFVLDVNGTIGDSDVNNYRLSNGIAPIDRLSWINGLTPEYNFGVGTITPQYTLDVNGKINFTTNLLQNGEPFTASAAVSSNSSSYSGTSSFTTMYPDITDKNQQVGIDQTSPQYALDVNGAVGNSNNGAYMLNDGNTLDFRSNFKSYVNGNQGGEMGENLFGVGNNNPLFTLDVSGDINYTGNLYQNGSPYTASLSINAYSASYVPNLYPQTFQTSGSWASQSVSSSYSSIANSSSYALTASYAANGGSGGGPTISASWASQSLSSSYATTASYLLPLSSSNKLFLQSTDGYTYQVTLTTDSNSNVFLTVGQVPVTGSNGFINAGTISTGNVRTISSSYTASSADYTIICVNTSSIGIYLTSSLQIGQIYNIKNYTSLSFNTIAVQPQNGTIDGNTSVNINGAYTNMEIQNVGNGNWTIL